MSDDDSDDLREDWLRHPFTLSRKEALKKDADIQRKVLFGACGESSDPKVRGHYAKFLELEAQVLIFERGGKKK
jgi:hypothetical protein